MLTHYYFCRILLPKTLNFISMGKLHNNVCLQIIITAILSLIYYIVFVELDRKRKII